MDNRNVFADDAIEQPDLPTFGRPMMAIKLDTRT
jgi:hypothetical protein